MDGVGNAWEHGIPDSKGQEGLTAGHHVIIGGRVSGGHPGEMKAEQSRNKILSPESRQSLGRSA